MTLSSQVRTAGSRAFPYPGALVTNVPVTAGVFTGVTTGGGDGFSSGLASDIRFTARATGTDFNGLEVHFIDAGVTAGNERVAYTDKLLEIAIQGGVTTQAQIVAAIGATPTRPFTASLFGADATVALLNQLATVETTGDLLTAATGTVGVIRFTSTRTGAGYNGLRVQYSDNGVGTAGREGATSQPGVNKPRVQNGARRTTASPAGIAGQPLLAPPHTPSL